ncbi:BCCT family transporter [Leucobacter sp. CSA2]|uniref:BCCT family transporter n=1 Tax=Leucobacter edaphi TaxID=2796472 RepID=A0A934QCG4_9MICO|nr:BCCT family transporter [Leucobacter edaphi]MBK0422084.1 BCCT family transporter [Leucobacter edaphi]
MSANEPPKRGTGQKPEHQSGKLDGLPSAHGGVLRNEGAVSGHEDTAKLPIGPHDGPIKRVIKRVAAPQPPHPGLIPGIGVEETGVGFPTNKAVMGGAVLVTLAVVAWAFIAPESLSEAGSTSLTWVTTNFGWLFGALAIACVVFMLTVGYGRTGGIRLGADDEEPEYSTASWISMLFAAGLGIGLLFYGPLEPLTYFLDPAPGQSVQGGTTEAVLPAMAQTILHWGPIAWAFYALVGGSIAYNAYRRGRAPLISALFEPVFPGASHRVLGRLIDFFAIIVTLFGTAVSLGIGALQIQSGFMLVTGLGELGNVFLVGSIAVLTSLFIASAVSGVKRGIRLLSNTNMIVTGVLALFVFIAGPTVYILNYMPASLVEFAKQLGSMLTLNANDGPEAVEFLGSWTTYYWAWWVSWTPFVGMFIAKISRGRTLREFVTTVVLVPSAIVVAWFVVYGSTAIYMTQNGADLQAGGTSEEVLFRLLQRLPLGMITMVLAMIAVLIFFVTAADSASIVMSSMSQSGRPEPSRWVTIMWGLLLGLIAAALLLAGGKTALSGLQSLMVVSALPFAFIVIGIMFAWAKDLRTDPYLIRRRYAQAAIAQGVRRGIDEYGDDFVFEASEVPSDEGAGAGFDSSDPALTDWYVEATTGPIEKVTAEDVRRVLEPGRIQPKGEHEFDRAASGDASLTVGERVTPPAPKIAADGVEASDVGESDGAPGEPEARGESEAPAEPEARGESEAPAEPGAPADPGAPGEPGVHGEPQAPRPDGPEAPDTRS